jgi:hypothetical protein
MRTTLKIETPTKALEVALKLVDGKQIVELELSDLLSLLDGKNTKAPTATAKAPTAPKAPKPAKAAKPAKEASAAPKISAKRGRKPKTAGQTATGTNEAEAVVDPTA